MENHYSNTISSSASTKSTYPSLSLQRCSCLSRMIGKIHFLCCMLYVYAVCMLYMHCTARRLLPQIRHEKQKEWKMLKKRKIISLRFPSSCSSFSCDFPLFLAAMPYNTTPTASRQSMYSSNTKMITKQRNRRQKKLN